MKREKRLLLFVENVIIYTKSPLELIGHKINIQKSSSNHQFEDVIQKDSVHMVTNCKIPKNESTKKGIRLFCSKL